MTEEHAVELERQWQLTKRARPIIADLGSRDRCRNARLIIRGVCGAADGLGDLALAVAADPSHRNVQQFEPVEHRPRAWTRHRVTTDEYEIELLRARIGEDGVQRIGVAVDVVQRKNPHAGGV